MKTKTIEKWLLLEQTGELSPRCQRLLNGCPEAEEKRAELNAMCSALPVLDAEPSPWAAVKIDARLRAERRPIEAFSKHWKVPLALAACLTLTVGILNFHEKKASSAPVVVATAAALGVDVWSVPIEEDLSKLESLIVAISDDPLDIMEM